MCIVISQGGKLEAVAIILILAVMCNGVIMNATQNIHPVEHYQVKM